MKNVIYGKGSFWKAFRYVFCSLDIAYYIDDVPTENDGVYPLEKVLSESEYRIIICDYKDGADEKRKKLEKLGLIYEKNFIYADEFYEQLNGEYYKTASDFPKNVVVWGTGKLAHLFKQYFPEKNIEYFIDSNMDKRGTDFLGSKVIHPNDIIEWDKHFIVIAVNLSEDIVSFLEKKKLNRDLNYITYAQISGTPAEMMEKVMNAPSKPYAFCNKPFEETFVEVGGVVYLCCPYLIKNIDIGTLQTESFKAIWNSAKAKIIRLSIIKRSFCFCDEQLCSHFRNTVTVCDKDIEYVNARDDLARMMISFDDSCNLKCKSCRKEYRFNEKDLRKKKALDLCVEGLKEVLPQVGLITFSGNGDPFYCSTYKKLWQHESAEKREGIRFQTNGLMLDEKMWKEIQTRYKDVYLYVSIDAATEETYQKVRCGGSWKVLMRNMELIAQKKKNGEIKILELSFVVQRDNFQEMADFAAMGLKWGGDRIVFYRLADWGLYSEEEFLRMSMYDRFGEALPDLTYMLEHPVFKDKRIDLNNLI